MERGRGGWGLRGEAVAARVLRCGSGSLCTCAVERTRLPKYLVIWSQQTGNIWWARDGLG
jgi:hypothetical protein